MPVAIMSITDAAAARIRALVAQAGGDVLGLRLRVKPTGCSGHAYDLSPATEALPFEEVVEKDGARLYIDPAATMFVVGAEMDWSEDGLQSSFTFSNPNEKGRCGCGESFRV